MIKYDCKTRWISLGKKLQGYYAPNLPLRKWGNLLTVGIPRSGKSALSKNIAVKVGQFRKVCIFDYNGEWKYHVTHRNYSNDGEALKLVHYKIIDNMVFYITDFNNIGDWVSLGFSGDQAYFMTWLAETKSFHKNKIDKFMEMLHDLPVGKKDLPKFNAKYSKHGLSLPNVIHFQSKRSAENRMFSVMDWFWTGETDEREVYDWNKLAQQYDHLIIDLSLSVESDDVGYARAYCGKILEKLWTHFFRDKWFFVIEEADKLAPKIGANSGVSFVPSSFMLINNLVSKAPKLDVSTMCITQTQDMVSDQIVTQCHIKIIAPCDEHAGREYDLAKHLRWNPDANAGDGSRTILLWLRNQGYSVFEPYIPSCRYK